MAYGLRISSQFPLLDLPRTGGRDDVTIHAGRILDHIVHRELGDSELFENPGAKFRFSERAAYLEWDRVGKVMVCDGKRVVVEPDPGSTLEDFSPFLTGPVLTVLLHQRGYFVLHASSVAVGNVGVAFVGPKGFGKSTMAAYLKARGHRLISDDIVPLSVGKEAVWTVSGFQRIKLYDDSIEAVGANPTEFPTIHRFASKRSFQLKNVLENESIQLHSIYIINASENLGISELSKADAFIELMKNAHLSRFLDVTKSQKAYFSLCKDITNLVPLFRLDRPNSLSELESIAETLEKHISRKN